MNFFIECTNTFGTEHNSGIQRVVRNLVKSAFRSADTDTAIPVIYHGRKFVGIKSIIPFPVGGNASSTVGGNARQYNQLKLAFHAATAAIARVLPFEKVAKFLYAPRTEFGLAGIVFAPISAIRFVRGQRNSNQFNTISMQAGDILILLDSSWSTDFWKAVDAARRRGVMVVVVIYDLIPLLHPQFCLPRTVASYCSWLEKALARADMLIAISRTTALDIQNELSKFFPTYKIPSISYFWLGSELDGESADLVAAEPNFCQIFRSGIPTYLYVSTIEPRKNHRYSLKAFNILWAMGINANYLIVGRVGWQSDEFISELQSHPEFGKRLFFFDTVDDSQLALLYRNAAGLVFTSYAEGFGLPLIEGLQRGLPVFASDIPVFREIGRAGVRFVDLEKPLSLATALKDHIAEGVPRVDVKIGWLTWAKSLTQLKDRIREGLLQDKRVEGKVVESLIPDLVVEARSIGV